MNVKIRRNLKPDENGIRADIDWDDGKHSTILFLKNIRVRVWYKGEESGGKWLWGPSDNLQVKMDRGGKYRFGT